jgi:hypothetical protein
MTTEVGFAVVMALSASNRNEYQESLKIKKVWLARRADNLPAACLSNVGALICRNPTGLHGLHLLTYFTHTSGSSETTVFTY